MDLSAKTYHPSALRRFGEHGSDLSQYEINARSGCDLRCSKTATSCCLTIPLPLRQTRHWRPGLSTVNTVHVAQRLPPPHAQHLPVLFSFAWFVHVCVEHLSRPPWVPHTPFLTALCVQPGALQRLL